MRRRQASGTAASRRTLSARIIIGLAAGAALGLLIGERASVLEVVADGYIELLQMTVLPYVTVSIVGGLGALSGNQARAIFARLGFVLVLLWTAAFGVVFLFPLMFPPHQGASFFSTTLLQTREPFDFLTLYIPTNPFNALANSVVPAVVVFSVIIGVALINVPDKTRLLDVLAVISAAVAKATHFVVAMTPYGVFAIAAVVAGTLSLAELQRLQVYLITYMAMSLLVAFWLLPALVATLTPVPYRELLSRSRNTLVMAFMTTSLFAVLPLLTEEAKELVKEYGGKDDGRNAAVDVVVPASFTFPHSGKLLSLSFLLFAAWFADTRVSVLEYPRLVGAGLLTMFGNVNAAIPFMLDLLRIPQDTFRLFVTSIVVNARFGTLVAAVHTLAVAILGTGAVGGMLTFNARKLLRFGIVTVVLTAALVGGTRALLRWALHQPYEQDAVLINMQALRDRGTARVFATEAAAPALPAIKSSVLERVRERGALRIGYFDDSLPYVFFNAKGDLVGLDVEMGLALARDLHVQAEFAPVSRSLLDRGLDSAECDIIMSGVVITADRASHVQFSASYLDETLAFVVADYRATQFSEWPAIQAMGRLRLGIPKTSSLTEKIREQLPDAEIVQLDRADDIFVPHDPPLDAVVATAERGSAYTLLHPAYSVAVPKPQTFKVPLAYVIAGRDAEMTSVVNTWIELKRKDDTVDELFHHWILGDNSVPKTPRWSVLHDVLHWL
jgi:Na+/H+-dicarboxylate symporter/ABC-type amino acid transport substrate-binding protein